MDSFEKLRILLIDDKEEDFLIIRTLLAESAIELPNLDWADSYESGLAALSDPCYDACLLDYTLGERSGLDLLSEARRRGAQAAVIFLAPHDGAHSCEEALATGAADFLAKDELNARAIRRSIRYAVERRKAELELARYRENLAELVKLRTEELQAMNLKLRMQVDERLAIDMALRRSEEKYRSLVNSSLDLTFTVDADDTITSLNPAFERATGWKTAEWIGRDCNLLIHPEDRQPQQECRRRILKGEALPPGEARIVVKSGGFRVFEFQCAPLYSAESIIGLIGTARDITDRKRAEEKIVQQNSFLRTVLESLSHPFYVVDAKDFSVVLANNAAIPGYLPRGVKCHSMFHRTDQPCSDKEHDCPLEEIRKTGKPLITEHIHYDHEGRARHVEVHGYPILDETGEVSQIIEYCLDISDRKEIEEKLRNAHDDLEMRVRRRTEELANANLSLMIEIAERKRAEEAQRLNEKRLEALLNLSQVPWTSEKEIAHYVLEQELKLTRSETGAIGFLDEEEKVVNWCAWLSAHAPLAGARTEEAGTWADAIKYRQPVVANEISDLEAAGKGLPFSLAPFRRFMSISVCDGERATAVTVVAKKAGSYDQSDLRQLTLLMDGMWKLIERERSIKALKDTENLAGIGRALSSVAHDMKTPLVAIGGFAKQVQRHLGPADPHWVKTEIILKETERLEKMVEDMLDFSKPVELRKSFEHIGPILAESVAVTKPLADAKAIELKIEAFGPIPALPLDPMRIKRVLINLLTNAIEASPKGQPVRIVHRRLGKDLVVDVSDKGAGIPCEIRKDIFSPFFTTRKGGTGLGLPIVKKVVEAHNGGIEVLNSPCGTTFRLRLPAC
ncbi:MAG: PAS domain S-box protein [Deltaproteobacteria bacterium]|jgi:PAS domain S-box-containing protein|nr:PAS domain S-box protein [Deltaproteobacteria bacterium]